MLISNIRGHLTELITSKPRQCLGKVREIKNEWPHLAFVFVTIFGVYAATTSNTVVLEDDGLFILTSFFSGVAHPPGYPLYTLFGHLFGQLPLESVATKIHLTSAFFGAATCAAIWWCVYQLVPGRLPAHASAFTFGFSSTFWSQSIVAEVYSLNCFFFFLLLALSLHSLTLHSKKLNGKGIRSTLVLIALIYGLSLSNHWPLTILATPALLIILWPVRTLIIEILRWIIPSFLIGLTPYLWMVLRSQSDPLISFYGPIDSLDAFWYLVSREGYRGIDSSGSAGLLDKVLFASNFIRQLFSQLTFLGFIFAAIGFTKQLNFWGTRITIALALAFVCSSFLLIGLLGFEYDELHIAAFRVYPLVSYGIMSLWLGLGIHVFSIYMSPRLGNHDNSKLILFASSLILIGSSFLVGLKINNRSEFSYSKDYAETVLNSLPKNSVLFASDDVGFGSIAYINIIQGIREDVTIYQIDGLVLNNRLFDPFTADKSTKVSSLLDFMQKNERPVYMLGSALPESGYDNLGFYAKFNDDLNSSPKSVFKQTLFDNYHKLMTTRYVSDSWLEIHRGHLSYQFGWVLGSSSSEEELTERLKNYPALTEGNFNGLLGLALGMISNPKGIAAEKLYITLSRIEELLSNNTSDRNLGMYFYAAGIYFLSVEDYKSANQFLEKSVDAWPHPFNAAISQLSALETELEIRETQEAIP